MVGCEATWKNRPHVGDYELERVLFKGNHSSNEVYCKQPEFNSYICWHYSEIADLIVILDKYKIKPEEAKAIKKLLKQVEKDTP